MWPPTTPRLASELPIRPTRSRRTGGRRIRWGVDLVQGLDDETEPAEQPHPVPVRRVELDSASRPVHLVGVALASHEPFLREPLAGRDAQRRQQAVGQEDQAPAGTQQSGCLRQPALRVTPCGGSVLADHHVKAPARQRNPLRVRLDERKGRSEPPLQTPSRRQLLAGQVQSDRLGPGRGQPRREIGGSTRQFNHIEVSYVAQDAEEPVWNREQPPHHLRSRPQRVGRGVGKAFVQHAPKRSVLCNLGGPIIRHPAKVGARHCVKDATPVSQQARWRPQRSRGSHRWQRLRVQRNEVDRRLGRERLRVQGQEPDVYARRYRLRVERKEVDRHLRRQQPWHERYEFDLCVGRQRLRVERDEVDRRGGRQRLRVQRHEVDVRLVHLTSPPVERADVTARHVQDVGPVSYPGCCASALLRTRAPHAGAHGRGGDRK